MRIKIIPPKSIHARFDIDEAVKYLEEKAEKMKNIAVEKAPIAKAPYIEVRGGKSIKRRPGRLKKNIKAKTKKSSIKVYIDTTNKGAPYGVYQELGFRHYKSGNAIPGKFFFETAFNVVMLDIQKDGIEIANRCLKIVGTNGVSITKYR